MTKNVGILMFEDAEVLDFAGPFEVFSVASQIDNYEPFRVFVVAEEVKPLAAVNGLKVLPDFTLKDHPKIDLVIIPGGQGTRKLLNNNSLLKWIENTHDASELTLSICSASRLFGKLGLLDHKPFCTHHDVYEHMNEIAPLGIPQKQKRFTQSDDRLFTSGGISAGIDLSFHILDRLLGNGAARRTADYMEYNYQS